MIDGADRPDQGIRHSFFIGVSIAFLVFLYLFSPFTQVFLGWFVDFEDNISHRVHEVTFGALFAMIFVGVLVQLRSTTRNFAGLVQASIAALILSVIITITTGLELFTLLYLAPLATVVWLHPGRQPFMKYKLQPHRNMVIMMGLISFSLLWGFVKEYDKAANEVFFHKSHWAGMAAFALTLLIVGYLAAFRVHGWPLLAWTTGASVGLYGVLSLGNRFDASARPGATGVLIVIWAGVFIFFAVRAKPVPAVVRQRVAVDAEVTRRPLPGRRSLRQRLFLGGVLAVLAVVFVAALGHSGAESIFNVIILLVAASIFFVWRRRRRATKNESTAPSDEQPAGSEGIATRSRREVLVRTGLGIAGTFVIGIFGAMLAREATAPPVPHIITTSNLNSCITCHVTGEENAPTIDWRNHHSYETPWLFPSCTDCHELPKVTIAGAATPSLGLASGSDFTSSQAGIPGTHLDEATAATLRDLIGEIRDFEDTR